ncbi:MAG: response regulator transcription factor [Chloroflexota bacterium]|jgi:two-component system, NarL family, response regulator LiaR
MREPIRLLLVVDHTIMGQGIEMLLSQEPDLHVVEKVVSGVTAVTRYQAVRPDVTLLTVSSPLSEGGLAVIAALRRTDAAARLVVLSIEDSDQIAAAAIRAGATGYLLKEASLADLVKAIRTVYEGRPALSPDLMLKLIELIKRPSTPDDSDKLLTLRESDIVRLVAQGLTNQEIADHLIISERTVRTHISHILLKLNLSNRTQLALHALRHGWVRLDGTLAK